MKRRIVVGALACVVLLAGLGTGCKTIQVQPRTVQRTEPLPLQPLTADIFYELLNNNEADKIDYYISDQILLYMASNTLISARNGSVLFNSSAQKTVDFNPQRSGVLVNKEIDYQDMDVLHVSFEPDRDDLYLPFARTDAGYFELYIPRGEKWHYGDQVYFVQFMTNDMTNAVPRLMINPESANSPGNRYTVPGRSVRK